MYRKKIKDVAEIFKSNVATGLTTSEAEKRLAANGYNELNQEKKESLLVRLLNQFKDAMIIILIIAAVVSIAVEPSDITDSIIIIVVVLLNAILGVVQESRAEKSLEALKALSAPKAKVVRDGTVQIIDAKNLVVGDVIHVEAGDLVPSDARIINAYNLKVDESALTGESVPVEKTNEVIVKESVIGDQTNMLFQSCIVTYGRGEAIVTATGMDNEVGKIAGMLIDQQQELTPLQVKLNEIGKVIGILCIVICAVVFALEWLSGMEMLEAFKTAIALAVAAVPEGLAAVVTIVLALSVQSMVKQNAIIRRLPAVETLGSTSIVCSDKTGTLTQNKMTVVKTYISDDEVKDVDDCDKETKKMLEYFSLCTDAKIIDGKEIGDPTETALVIAADRFGTVKEELEKKYPRLDELAFDSDRKMMSVILKGEDGKIFSITKGGPDIILKRCNNVDFVDAMAANDEMAHDALRVLALAVKQYEKMPENISSEEIESEMTFIGFVGMIDPARPEVKEAIASARHAGIRTIMITGDHKTTATAIAKDLGIIEEGQKAVSGDELEKMSQEELEAHITEYSVYARVAPEHKVRIVKAWQKQNQIVAMTGDGVNDAPALKAADIGCAMGITGTDVAKGAAAMVLTDDNFATIISSVKQGRGIFDNIRKDVQYLLSSNVGEVLTIFVASIISLIDPSLGFGVPLLPVHLLWVNLITDSFPAFALGMEPVEDDVMDRKPRKKDESFFANGLLTTIIWQGIVVGALTLASYAIGNQYSHEYGMTMAFITLSTTQLFHSFNVKSKHTIFSKRIFNNKSLIGSFLIGVGLQALIIIVPVFSKLFKLEALDPIHLLTCVGLAFCMVIVVEISKLISNHK